jgi:hypothetical protein
MPKKERNIVSIAKLERAGALQILVYLCKNVDKGKLKITDITKNVKASIETVNAAVTWLKENSLCEEEWVKSFPPMHLVWLTPKGAEVAQYLVPVADLLLSKEHKE